MTKKTPQLPGKWIIFSGAGLSSESGLSTYRSEDGLWANHSIQDVCHANTWRKNRSMVREFYNERWYEVLRAKPHAGHEWCANMEKRGALLITQNVDTLLEKAGAENVIHVHGRLDRYKCFNCDTRWYIEKETPECCLMCGSEDIRVDVVFFGENAPAYKVMDHELSKLTNDDTLVIIGTSAEVVNPLHYLQSQPRILLIDPAPPISLMKSARVEVIKDNAKNIDKYLPLPIS